MTTTETVKFNPFSPEFHSDPYPIYARLQAEDPIHWSFLQAWIITRYADAAQILKDSRFQVDDLPERLQQKNRFLKQGDLNPLSQTIAKWLFFLDTPDHNRLRSLVAKVFSPGSIEAMRPTIQVLVNDLIDQVIDRGEMDVMSDFAAPLPAMTITSILGVPKEDFHKLVRWSHELFFVFDQPMSIEGYQRQNAMAIEAREYLSDLIVKQEEQPTDGLISQLIAARDQGKKLSHDEILGFCIMLFIVGQETTKSLIGNGILALLQHPESINFVRDNPNQIKPVVEELLRYDSPVQVLARLAAEDVEIGDKTIRSGDKVIVCLGAANRDPAQFAHPDQLDWDRQHTNLPFGGGMHYCLGAALARMQGQLAIQTLVRRLHRFSFNANQLDWRESITLRGLSRLPIEFQAIDS
ncbi:cytochrome P450 [filamentous cyanobacterium LEGE 11480]|uniref:Cytochrome P450 n=1 Tax=Romeriopsis navalis LEGE 11480 TaxID=2777977 RepID=A0A928VI58_9CYAN|nr:cytochrome P450 [Romeriopsis navalis]MBE9029053.1 cytochrome P450 [Romeriopsis navalis LEGE 11480]